MRQRIAEKYAKIEVELVRKFSASFRSQNTQKMKEYANSLMLFPTKGYEDCIKFFIEESLPSVSHLMVI